MVGKILGLILTLLVFQNGQCEDPPVVSTSYIAWGEVVQSTPSTEDLIIFQMAFEESYDADSQNSAFLMTLSGKNMTFFKNYKTNQTFLYVETDKSKMECKETSEQEWLESDFAPGLLAFEDDDGSVKFSLYQLLNIPKNFLMEKLQGVSTSIGGIPSKSWTYLIKSKKKNEDGFDTTLSITSYWSDDKWNTSAGRTMTPLGFNVSNIIYSDPVVVKDYVINVFGFVFNTYDHKHFEPHQGIICASRKSTLKFPSVKNIRAISLHSEMALTQNQELRYIDTWLDPENQLVRVDAEKLKGEDPTEHVKHYQSEIAIGKMGIVYRLTWYKGESQCKVLTFEEYENDFQNFFDIKQDLRVWHMRKIFGLDDTPYVYIGKTTKNDIPCHLFQGIRTDWPDKSANMQSLWEWCFNVNMTKENDIVMFQEDEFGLISADVTILSEPKKIWSGYRLNHHFYKVQAQDPKVLDATSFDIGRCFKDTEKKLLQFYLNVGIAEDNKELAENATSDVNFLQKWKAAIYHYSGLNPYTLRVTGVSATIDENKLFIRFSILPVHEGLPKGIKDNEVTSYDAETKLRTNVNEEKVSITHPWYMGKVETLSAVKHSVSYQVNPNFKPRELPTLPPTTTVETTPFVFTLRTEPGKEKSTATATDKTSSVSDPVKGSDPDTEVTSPGPVGIETTTSGESQIQKITGHGPGTVASISIAMLAVGITMGSFATFFKFNGLPPCLKCGNA